MTDKTVSLPNGSDTATFRDVPRSYLRTLELEYSQVLVNDGTAEDNILIQTAILRTVAYWHKVHDRYPLITWSDD
jgi:hypothetical protein